MAAHLARVINYFPTEKHVSHCCRCHGGGMCVQQERECGSCISRSPLTFWLIFSK